MSIENKPNRGESQTRNKSQLKSKAHLRLLAADLLSGVWEVKFFLESAAFYITYVFET